MIDVIIWALAILIGVILIGVLYVYMVYRKLLRKLDRQETKMNHILSLLGHLQSGSGAIDRNLHVVIKSIPELRKELIRYIIKNEKNKNRT